MWAMSRPVARGGVVFVWERVHVAGEATGRFVGVRVDRPVCGVHALAAAAGKAGNAAELACVGEVEVRRRESEREKTGVCWTCPLRNY